MSFIDPKIESYSIEMSTRPSSVCEALEVHTRKNEEMSQMLIGPLEASFLGLLLRSLRAKRVLELGTFTGYSALAMAENLEEDGEIHTIDLHKKDYTERFWLESGHSKKIHSHLGPALDVLPKLAGTFDLVFIDADKENYIKYFHLAEQKLSPHGVIVVDNVLWSGKVLKSDVELQDDSSSLAVKRFNEMIQKRTDLHKTLLPIRDGIFLISRKVNK